MFFIHELQSQLKNELHSYLQNWAAERFPAKKDGEEKKRIEWISFSLKGGGVP